MLELHEILIRAGTGHELSDEENALVAQECRTAADRVADLRPQERDDISSDLYFDVVYNRVTHLFRGDAVELARGYLRRALRRRCLTALEMRTRRDKALRQQHDVIQNMMGQPDSVPEARLAEIEVAGEREQTEAERLYFDVVLDKATSRFKRSGDASGFRKRVGELRIACDQGLSASDLVMSETGSTDVNNPEVVSARNRIAKNFGRDKERLGDVLEQLEHSPAEIAAHPDDRPELFPRLWKVHARLKLERGEWESEASDD